MIGGRVAALLLGAALALGPGGAGDDDPVAAARRAAWLRATAADAEAAVAALDAQLLAAREPARAGAALIVAGEEPAAPPLREAADLLEAAAGDATAAAVAMDRLRGTLRAVAPEWLAIARGDPPLGADLAGIAGQLRDTAEAAGPFVTSRRATERTLGHLAAALAALDRTDPTGALHELEDADRALDVVAAWEAPPATLPLWLETTRELVAAARRIAQATIDEDPAAAAAAAAAYEAAAEDARRADASLAISLAEAGGGLSATPLRRLADALARVAEARAGVASVLQMGR